MADTTFVDRVTPINASWLNDVNDAVYHGTGVFLQSGTGAVARTAQDKMRDVVSAEDFGAGAAVADNSTPYANAIGTGGKKIRLDAVTYPLTSSITIAGKSNLWIKGVPGRTRLTSATLRTLLLFTGTVTDVVIEDVEFESTLVNAAELSAAGLVYSDNANLSRVTFVRCGFSVNDAYSNAIKLVCDTSELDRVRFYDCYITGAGRMGLEVQNHNAVQVTRYSEVEWIGGRVANTGLVGVNGMGISLSGKGTDCKVDARFDNNLTCALEVVGASNSTFSGRAVNQTRAVDVISMSGTYVTMTDNTLEDFKCVGAANGFAKIYSQIRLRERGNILNLSGGFTEYRNVIDGRSSDCAYISNEVYALYMEGETTGNVWENAELNNSASTGNFATVRFSGADTTGNQFLNPVIRQGTGGNPVDQVGGALVNYVHESVNAVGVPINRIVTFDLSADLDLTTDANVRSLFRYTSATGPFSVTLPATSVYDAWHLNETSQSITLKCAGQPGEVLAAGARKRAVFSNTDIHLF